LFSHLFFSLREFQEWLAILGQLVTLAGRCSNYANVFAVLGVFLFVLFKSTISNSFGTANSINVFLYILSFILEGHFFHGPFR